MPVSLVKYGVGTTAAVAQGAIDGVSGFLVEAGILVVALVVSDGAYAIGGDTNWQAILLIAVGVVAVGAVTRQNVPGLPDSSETGTNHGASSWRARYYPRSGRSAGA
jgi:hypothetical protein